ncbi:MAG: hypothetical protein M3Y37_03920, partial [Chloroflexota bacterium]|nr:hypothetical protein [Chloroflexota bacterium]
DKRILLCDNLIMTGNTMTRFLDAIRDLGGKVIGIATVWNSGAESIGGIPVFGLLNTLYDSQDPASCVLCREGVPIVEIPY